jgi:cyclophilin family peptidyl-prolyl cis-trans isomerase/HEAT repeat protein
MTFVLQKCVLIALMAAAGSCAVTPRSKHSVRDLHVSILGAESRRDALDPAIRRGLTHHDQKLRVAALRALARIEEPSTARYVFPLLGDRDPIVARWAAFAAGQIGGAGAEAALVESLNGSATDPGMILRSLGRAATASVTPELAQRFGDINPTVRGAAATAVGLIAKRLGADQVMTSTLGQELAKLIRDPEPQVREGATYAFMRMPGPAAASSLPYVLGDRNPEIRAMAVRGLGQSEVALQTLDTVLTDPDWRVRYEAVQAIGNLGESNESNAPAAAQRLMSILTREVERFGSNGTVGSGTSTHVIIAIITAAGRLGEVGDAVLRRLRQVDWRNMGRFDKDTQLDAARIHCQLSYALDVKDNAINEVRTCGSARLLAWRRLEFESRLLELQGPAGIPGLKAMLQYRDSKVRVLATMSLGNIESPMVNANLATLLDYRDPYVVAAASTWLLNPQIASNANAAVVTALGTALRKMSAQADPNFVVGVIDAIGALGKKGDELIKDLAIFTNDARPAIRRRVAAVMSQRADRNIDYGKNPRKAPYKRPAPIGGRPVLTIHTVRGKITIEMFGDVAPRTVGVITDLAKRGFYDGKTWHRIVPNFVAQGGCSRGDGWGGPGYAVDEETSLLPFVRGAVGVATNGRDTGGSQFFIMHSAHPHLNGSYTIFGHVRDGMDAADALQADDRILKAEVRVPRSRSSQKRAGGKR